MKKLLVAGIAAAALYSAPVLAADYPAKAAPMASVFNWSGFYAGGNIGWGRADVGWTFDPAIPAAANQSYKVRQSGLVGGVQGGIQQQFGNWVLGVEANWDVSDRWGKRAGFGNNPARDSEVRTDYFTVGPRLGWAMNNSMLYGTGGWAEGRIDTRAIVNATGALADATSAHHTGWFLGGGWDYAITPVLIFGVDYRHIHLGTKNQCDFGNCVTGAAVFTNVDVNANIDVVTARLSLKFNTVGFGRP